MARARRDECGETLVEILVTTTILSLAAVAIMTGLALAVKASDIQRKETTGGAYVRNYAEALASYIAQSNAHYVACATTTDYSSSTVGFSPPSGFTPSVLKVQPVSFTGAVGTFPSPCGSSNDTGVQAVTLSVASTDNRANEKLTVLIRKPCPGTGANPCS
jgi:type II secretory pathway pseudopilin PulG